MVVPHKWTKIWRLATANQRVIAINLVTLIITLSKYYCFELGNHKCTACHYIDCKLGYDLVHAKHVILSTSEAKLVSFCSLVWVWCLWIYVIVWCYWPCYIWLSKWNYFHLGNCVVSGQYDQHQVTSPNQCFQKPNWVTPNLTWMFILYANIYLWSLVTRLYKIIYTWKYLFICNKYWLMK